MEGMVETVAIGYVHGIIIWREIVKHHYQKITLLLLGVLIVSDGNLNFVWNKTVSKSNF